MSRAISFKATAFGIAVTQYMTASTESVLNLSINALEFTPEFKAKAEQLGLYKLADLVDQSAYDLLKLPGFNHRLLFEYINFLEKEKLGHHVKP